MREIRPTAATVLQRTDSSTVVQEGSGGEILEIRALNETAVLVRFRQTGIRMGS